MSPVVSIIIPCYNYENYVLNCIDSCVRQDYKGKIEIIVVDDCSTDGSHEKILKYAGDKVTLLRTRYNLGYSKAKNDGIAASCGEFIVAIDADDMLTLDSISKRVEWFEAKPETLLVHAQAWIIQGDGDLDYWMRRFYKISQSGREDKIHAQSVMVRREVYQKYGLYDESLRSRSDNEMWFRLKSVACIGNKFYYENYPVAFYRKHDLSMIEYRKKNPQYNAQISFLLEEHKNMRLNGGITTENTRFLK